MLDMGYKLLVVVRLYSLPHFHNASEGVFTKVGVVAWEVNS